MPAKKIDGKEEDLLKLRFPKISLLSEGNKYIRLLQFDKAIPLFDKIIESFPEDAQSLLGRAKCYMRLAKFEEALIDFDLVTKLNPKCIEAVHLKGLTQFLRGNFEKSFITFWDGRKRRPTDDNLRIGFHACKKTIESNLEVNKQTLTKRDVSEMNQLLRNKDLLVQDTLSTDYNKKGFFATDLKLLESMLHDKNLISLHSLCRNLFDYLRDRQQFWEMQTPRSAINKSRAASINKICDLVKMNRLVRNFGLCRTAIKEEKTEFCIKKGSEVLSILRDISPDLPEKIDIEAETLHCLGMAYMIEKSFPNAMKCYRQQLKLAKENDMDELKERAFRDLGEFYFKTNKYRKALQFFQDSLQFNECENEQAILWYKISDCNIHLNNLEDAKQLAQKCLDYVGTSENARFQFDVLLLLAEISVKGKDMKVAEEQYKHALEIAIQNNDDRRYDLESLLKIFEEMANKQSHSKEGIEIMKMTDSIKHT